MSKINTKYRFLFAAGGTGGHLYPAIAVAQKIRELKPEADILFVGTKNKLEAEIVPKEGFRFKSIPVRGFQRNAGFKNILFPFTLIGSMLKSLFINIGFKPKVAIGTGAYVAGPPLWAASFMGAKIILIEQNSYPGLTNRLLEKKAEEIHITYKESENYFHRKEILRLTGNPLRVNLNLIDKKDALTKIGLKTEKKTLLIIGGSLGAASINKTIAGYHDILINKGVQIIWQTGKQYYSAYKKYGNGAIKVFPYLERIEDYYSCADLIVARAGASTIAELAYLGLPALLVPSPNVAENHQFKNSEALYKANACDILQDTKLNDEFISKILSLIKNEEKLMQFSTNIKQFANLDAAEIIAKNAIGYAEQGILEAA